MSEFDLIKRYFTRATPGTELGVGDDAALVRLENGMELAVSTDMLVSGTHFLPDADPFLLGHKTLAVNLSDMAAMGAQPRWATLAVSLPQADEAWLEQFSAGFFALAQKYGVELIGGDTTRGPLNLCVTIMGVVPKDMALRRAGAQVGDDVWVSGTLGDAALALAHQQGRVQLSGEAYSFCTDSLHRPDPRIALGQMLRGVAHCAIDVSDGLLADLGHMLKSAGVGAEIRFDALPVSEILRPRLGQPVGKHCVLAGGDDYELCFAVPVVHRSGVEEISRLSGLPLTLVGTIVTGNACKVVAADGSEIIIGEEGYDHFK